MVRNNTKRMLTETSLQLWGIKPYYTDSSR